MPSELIEILQIPHGIIRHEDNVRNYIKKRIPRLTEDRHGNLYLINENTPLFCSHMDNVGSKEAQRHLKKIKYNDGIIKGTHNMGADDKVGIYICLKMYEYFWDKISLLFCVQEETGGIWSTAFDKSLIATNTYCVIPDRFGTSDIIGVGNDYCTVEFQSRIQEPLAQYGFKPAVGIWCDADHLQASINCINISCGYYKHHTDQEYVEWDTVCNTIEALKACVWYNIPRMEPPEDSSYPSYYGWYNRFDPYSDTYISSKNWGCLMNIATGKTIEVPKWEWEFTEYVAHEPSQRPPFYF